ncbi:MAG: hypothetical protein QW786_01395 [Candidatus Hadarchaeum sp.]|nr:MAG: hypothetical protein KatS3mg097_390 [Candidatus Parcubacteria bacterium]
MTWRQRRRLIYISIFASIVIFIFVAYLLSLEKIVAQCANGVKDDNEEGIDCGGPCVVCEIKNLKPLSVFREVRVIVYPDKTVDLFAVVQNLNENLGLRTLKYQFLIFDQNNNLRLKTNMKTTSLSPLEVKWLSEINLSGINFDIGKVKLYVEPPQDLDWFKDSPTSLPIVYQNQKVVFDNNNWQFSASFFNKAFSRIDDVEIIVFGFDLNQRLLAASKALVSFKAEESKNISLPFPQIETNQKIELVDVIVQKKSF